MPLTLTVEAELDQSQGLSNLTAGFQCRQSGDSPKRSDPSSSVPSQLQPSTANWALCSLENASKQVCVVPLWALSSTKSFRLFWNLFVPWTPLTCISSG